MGIWVSVDGGSFLQLLGPFARQGMQFVNVGFFCIAIGAVLVLLGLLGCCGAHKESKCLLLVVGISGSRGFTMSIWICATSTSARQENLPRSVLIVLGNINLRIQKLMLREKLGFSLTQQKLPHLNGRPKHHWSFIIDQVSVICHQ